MFEYDEFGNPIRIGAATASTMGDDRRNAAGAFTGQYPGIQPGAIAGGGPNTGGLMPTGPGIPPYSGPFTGTLPEALPPGESIAGFENYPLGQPVDPRAATMGGLMNPTLPAALQQIQANPMQDMAVIQPRPPGVQTNMSPMSSLGAGQFDIPGGMQAPGSVADTSMQAMKTLGVDPIAGGSGPNTGGLASSALSGPAVQAYSAGQSGAAGAGAAGAAGNLNLESAGMIAGGVMGVAGGITDIVQGGRAIKSAQSDQRKQQAEIDRLKASQPSLSTPAEYYERVKGAYDTRLMQMRTEDINKNLANTTAAATSFGSRGLGALAGATQQANRAQRQEVLQQQQLQTAALGDLAGAQERSTGLKEARNTRETTYAQNQLDQAEQAEAMARQQRMAGIASTVGGVAKIGMGVLNPASALPVPMEEGGKVQKTPGKFSHDENEMAVITEEGEDTGVRVTGGEYVLNPDQASSIKKLVEAGDKDALMKFMDGLLDEPQFA